MTNFVSAEGIYAEVKEKLKSYFDSGSIDDVMFPKYTQRAMAKFRMSSKPIKETFIPLHNFTGDLPSDFHKVRELWACTVEFTDPIKDPSAYYYQTDCRITPIFDKCNECFDEEDYQPCSIPAKYRVTHKVQGYTIFEYKFSHYLRPGNYNAKSHCGAQCPNIGCDSPDTFDIDGCKISTSFREGSLHLIYYSDNSDEDGNILIPDNAYVQQYLIDTLVFRCFEALDNQVTDESSNLIYRKKSEARQDMDSSYISASLELKKQSIYKVKDNITKSKQRFNGYKRSLR